MVGDCVPQLVDPLSLACDRGDDRWTPWHRWPDVKHGRKIGNGPIGVRPVCLVDDEDVSDLEKTGFRRLDPITPARRHSNNRGVRRRCDLDFRLSDTDGLDNDLLEPKAIKCCHHGRRRTGYPAEMPTVRKRADEHRRVTRVLAHPYAVSKYRST